MNRPYLDSFLVLVAALCRDVRELEDAAVAVLQTIPIGLNDHGAVFGHLIPEIQGYIVK